jgi:hypothetical protein
MALILIKETGAGLANANAYANAADGDAYHDGHLYARRGRRRRWRTRRRRW